MKFLSCMLLMAFLTQAAVLAGDEGQGDRVVDLPASGDQFERAMLEVIAVAAREGKKITVKRMDYATEGGGAMIGSFPANTPMTSVIAVEIRDPAVAEEPSQRFLLKNQEEIIKALNVICEGQLDAGEKLSNVAGISSELDQAMRGLSSGVDSVNEGVSATYSEVVDVSEVSQDSAVTLESIKKELRKLNQTVQSLLSSMGQLEGELSALAIAVEDGSAVEAQEEGGDTSAGKSSEGESTKEGGDESPSGE